MTASLTNNEYAPATNQEFAAQLPPLDPLTSAFVPDTVSVPPAVSVPRKRPIETLIEGRAINPAERLHFLGKYVAGYARELIKGFRLLDGEDAYQKAKETLKRRFGDSFNLRWPQLSRRSLTLGLVSLQATHKA